MSKLSQPTQGVFLFAARYAHTRSTGASYAVVSAIKEHWHSLSEQTQKQLKREAKNDALTNLDDWAELEEL
jgi:TRAP-type C4-dicarboxylate transport system substrate-binding protein